MANNPPPPWLLELVTAAKKRIAANHTVSQGARSAVLLLFADGDRGPDIVIIQRAAKLRNHAGQAAFPGGVADSPSETPTQTSLREANEEIGLNSDDVTVVGELPPRFIPVSGFLVAPVVGWWAHPSPVRPMDAAEVSRVERVPLVDLANPQHRFRVQHPSGYIGPAFAFQDMVIWGFTAGLLDLLLDVGGWARPWDPTVIRQLPSAIAPVDLETDY